MHTGHLRLQPWSEDLSHESVHLRRQEDRPFDVLRYETDELLLFLLLLLLSLCRWRFLNHFLNRLRATTRQTPSHAPFKQLHVVKEIPVHVRELLLFLLLRHERFWSG